ncbi:MAG: CHAT domain-containing protein [Gammaproteobacteria bacterium]|nr:CHAT domain-containing protein [Gammaproteobacteria bacterium]
MEKSAKTILLLAANPKGTPPRYLDREAREIDNGLQRARHRFILKQQWAARPVDIRRAMLDHKPDIVHFCGHGDKAGIAFEDENGESKPVSARALADFFKLFSDRVECVVLNACYSGPQAQAIARHIPSVIGVDKNIGHEAAQEFAVAFYDALGAGENIEFAHKLGCAAIQMAGFEEQPVLIRNNPHPRLQKMPNPFGDQGRISDPARFFGREAVLRNLFEMLRKSSNIALLGDSGTGKSSLISQLCRLGPAKLALPSAAFVDIDMQLFYNEADFFDELCQQFNIPSLTGYKFNRALQGKRYILCLDQMEALAGRKFSRVRSRLRGLADGAAQPLCLVLASRSPLDVLFPENTCESSSLTGICHTLSVPCFSRQETEHFISARLSATGVQFTDADRQTLWEETQ